MSTRINFGLHNTFPENFQPLETILKVVGYNFLCAKRHFEQAFSNKPEIFVNGSWQATTSDAIHSKTWHIIMGILESIPIFGHLIAIIDWIFTRTYPLPEVMPLNLNPPDTTHGVKPNDSLVSSPLPEIPPKPEPLQSGECGSANLKDPLPNKPENPVITPSSPKDGGGNFDLNRGKSDDRKKTNTLGKTKTTKTPIPAYMIGLDHKDHVINTKEGQTSVVELLRRQIYSTHNKVQINAPNLRTKSLKNIREDIAKFCSHIDSLECFTRDGHIIIPKIIEKQENDKEIKMTFHDHSTLTIDKKNRDKSCRVFADGTQEIGEFKLKKLPSEFWYLAEGIRKLPDDSTILILNDCKSTNYLNGERVLWRREFDDKKQLMITYKVVKENRENETIECVADQHKYVTKAGITIIEFSNGVVYQSDSGKNYEGTKIYPDGKKEIGSFDEYYQLIEGEQIIDRKSIKILRQNRGNAIYLPVG